MNFLEKISVMMNKLFVTLAGVLVFAMIVLSCSNIFLRTVWLPLKGTFELMGFLGAVVAAFALGQTHLRKEHIGVDVLINLMPSSVRAVLDALSYTVGALFFGVAAWQTFLWGSTLRNVNELSETLRIAYYPFVYAVALGCALISFTLIVDVLNYLMKRRLPA